MTPTPPSSTSSPSNPAGPSSDQFRVVRKRNRVPLSCAPCRHRKLKCNRHSPCDNCTKRGDAANCTYAAPTTRKKGSQSHGGPQSAPDDMQNRIDRLEGLVLSLMTNGAQSAGPAAAQQVLSAGASSIGSGSLGPSLDAELEETQMMDENSERGEEESETDGVTKSFGILKVDAEKQKTFYVGEAHWAALLSEISEVKNYFVAHKKDLEAQMERVTQIRRNKGEVDAGAGPALLFGATIPPSRAEILGQVPSRYMSDILIGRYFNTFDPATHILHGPTFQRQYNTHWADPSKTSIVWIAMLFAMMRLAMISYGREGDEPPEFRGKCHDLAANFRTQMAHCLITADYTKPHNHLIETLIFHLHAEYTINSDAESSIWVLVGMIARLSMRMGFHRDSKFFPQLSPFQAEMRRRIWTFVRSADLLFSFQMALPSMIRIGDSDTELPRNIYDDEFDENSTELPPGRPASEATPISYMVAKGRLAFGFGRVLEEVNGMQGKPYDEILQIDRGLREIYESIPEHLKLRPMSEQTLAPISLIVARFSLATVYHKSQCVLHRRYLRQARGNNRYMHSRRTCLDSAMQMLSFQAIQYAQSQERGRMRNLRNHVNSLTTHDYLLAATVVCMDLYNHRSDRNEVDVNTPSTSVSGNSRSQGSEMSDGPYMPGLSYTREDMIRALEESRSIWVATRDLSMEAYKAGELLKVLLEQIRAPYQPSPQNPQGSVNVSSRGSNNDEQTAAMTLGLLQSGGMTPQSQAANIAQQAQNMSWDKNNAGPLFNNEASGYNMAGFVANGQGTPVTFPSAGNLFGIGTGEWPDNMNIDWETWDSYMPPSNISLDPASNLWSNPPENNLFSQTTSPPTADPGTFDPSSNFFPQSNVVGMMGPPTAESNKQVGPILSESTTNTSSTTSAGDAFMGAASPPTSWKWTVMSDKK